MASHTPSSSGTKTEDYNDLIILRLSRGIITPSTVTFVSGNTFAEGFGMRMPHSEWAALGKPEEITFIASTAELGVAGHDTVVTHDRQGVKLVPIAHPFEEELTGGWSDPVQVKIEGGALVYRKLLEATGDDFDHWAGRKFWEVEREQ